MDNWPSRLQSEQYSEYKRVCGNGNISPKTIPELFETLKIQQVDELSGEETDYIKSAPRLTFQEVDS